MSWLLNPPVACALLSVFHTRNVVRALRHFFFFFVTCPRQLAADLEQCLFLFVLRLFLDGPNVIRKDERLVHVVLDIRNSSNKNTTHRSRTLIVKMPPEQPCLDMFGCLIYDTLLLECDHSQVRSLEVNV